ncbi:MAG: MBL fold metallo-hydrolase [Candidatus Eisenbacteria sp.]|nr:MBL fold metallo-hydrolase [Candidatus Eisenbacteria bacterium]
MLTFRSFRSGSSGNLLLLEGRIGRRRTRLLIDCGIRSQRGCRQALEEEVGLGKPIDALIVTHAHGDHINYSALRVMADLEIPVYLHQRTSMEVTSRYLNPYRLPARVDPSSFLLRRFGTAAFSIGMFTIKPVPVPHAPEVTTHAFVIRCGSHRLLVANDFNDPQAIAPHIHNCDFIYLESNHDLELLRLYFNPASLYHLSNPAAAQLLQYALQSSRRPPGAVMLGHLSEDRNRPALALETVRAALGPNSGGDDLALIAAPRHTPSEIVVIAE